MNAVEILLEDETHVIAWNPNFPGKSPRLYTKRESTKGTYIMYRAKRVYREEWKYGEE